jgi:hypothetical protein
MDLGCRCENRLYRAGQSLGERPGDRADLGGYAAANDLIGKPDVEVREAIGDKFPKRIYHSIACIGALVLHREPDYWAVGAVGAPHVGDGTEKQQITAFCDKVAELSLSHVCVS